MTPSLRRRLLGSGVHPCVGLPCRLDDPCKCESIMSHCCLTARCIIHFMGLSVSRTVSEILCLCVWRDLHMDAALALRVEALESLL